MSGARRRRWQCLSIRFCGRRVNSAIVASIGFENLNNALADAVDGLYKSELIYDKDREEQSMASNSLPSELGLLVQNEKAAELARRHPTSRVRGHLLRLNIARTHVEKWALSDD